MLPTLLLLSLTAAVGAETGGMLLECPGPDWAIYRDRFEASCMKLMPEPRKFDAAFKACFAMESRLLSLLHKRSKVVFVNDLIIGTAGENHTLWFFDPLDTHQELVKEPRAPDTWLVINPNADPSKIELVVNMTAVPRSFICEAPARPAAQRPQFEREPEDVFISVSAELLLGLTAIGGKEAGGAKPPFIVTFNCQSYGIPKPTVEWVLTSDTGNGKALTVEAINATVIHYPRLPLSDPTAAKTIFFILQRDCKAEPCPADNIQERSQLIVVNPQFMDPKRIACVTKNDFGSVLSREAQVFATRLGTFANQTESVAVKAGVATIVSNVIAAEPDAASAECFRVLKPANGPAKLVPIEEVNRVTRGAIQMSRATFELIFDAAAPDDAGEYMCQARMHNGRLGHVSRERTIGLSVQPCVKADGCDLATKPVAVANGYPLALSMNPLSNRDIRAGDDFLLECPCTGKRHPDEELMVNWNLNNRTDLPAVVFPLLPKGSALLVRNADSKVHSGLYQCQCVRGKDQSAWSSVSIAVLPSAVPADYSDIVRVKAGEKATLTCRVASFNGPMGKMSVSVQPLRGLKPLAEVADSKRFTVSRTGANQFSITVTGAKEKDADVYGCRVITNYMGKWVDYNTYYTTLVVDKAQ